MTDASDSSPESESGAAAYVFRVQFRLEPSGDVRVAPSTFETVLRRPADPPGEAGWRLFRDTLWRGEVGDEAHLRELAADVLGVAVDAVSFQELETDEAYLEALRAAIAADLDAFNADSVDEVLRKYLGSSIRVT